MLSVRPKVWLAAMRIRAACDHVLHANSTLVDRVDLATPLSLSSQRLSAPRLLLPRSGLSRSDLVPWPFASFRCCAAGQSPSEQYGHSKFKPAFCPSDINRCLDGRKVATRCRMQRPASNECADFLVPDLEHKAAHAFFPTLPAQLSADRAGLQLPRCLRCAS